MNNVVCTVVEALVIMLGDINSLHDNVLDETLALSTEQSVEVALRTQIGRCSWTRLGVTHVADSLAGP